MKLRKIRRTKNKKAGVTDVFFVILTLAAIAFILLFTNRVWNDISDNLAPKLNNTGTSGDVYIQKAFTDTSNVFNTTFDFVFLIIFMGLILGIILTGFLVPVHPAFAYVFVLFLMMAVLIAVPLSNAFQDMAETDKLEDSSERMPMMKFILYRLPLITAIIGALMLITIYSRSRLAGGGLV